MSSLAIEAYDEYCGMNMNWLWIHDVQLCFDVEAYDEERGEALDPGVQILASNNVTDSFLRLISVDFMLLVMTFSFRHLR